MDPKSAGIMVLFLVMFATIGWALYLASDMAKRQRKMKVQAELRGRLLDKFSSAREVVEFLQTPSGAQFVDGMSNDREEPASGILRSTHRGIVLVIVSVGCLFLSWHWHYRYTGDNPLLAIGVLLLCLGVGFLISAAVSHRLSKTLGLAQRTGNTQQ